MEEKHKPKGKKILIALVVIAAVVGGYFYFQDFQGNNPVTNTIKVPFPYTFNVAGNTSFAL